MMKSTGLLLLILVICSSLSGQVENPRVIEKDTLKFSGELVSRKIPVALGEFFELPANCAKKPTTFIQSDLFIFPDAKLGKIDSCSMTYVLHNDTVREVILDLPDNKSLEQAGKQAGKQFGKPVYHKDGMLYVYTWTYMARGKKPIIARLEVNESLNTGVMHIEEKG